MTPQFSAKYRYGNFIIIIYLCVHPCLHDAAEWDHQRWTDLLGVLYCCAFLCFWVHFTLWCDDAFIQLLPVTSCGMPSWPQALPSSGSQAIPLTLSFPLTLLVPSACVRRDCILPWVCLAKRRDLHTCAQRHALLERCNSRFCSYVPCMEKKIVQEDANSRAQGEESWH